MRIRRIRRQQVAWPDAAKKGQAPERASPTRRPSPGPGAGPGARAGSAPGLDGLAKVLAALSGPRHTWRTAAREGGRSEVPAMIDAPQIVRTEVVRTACIHLTVRAEEMVKVMGPGHQELMAALKAQGIAPAGPWLTHHLRMARGAFDFELSVPVPRAVEPVGRVRPGQLPAATVARTVHHGPYEGLPGAWPQLDAWIVAQGRKPAGHLWEVYVAGPESGPDPARWRTELNRPLVE